MKHTIQVTQEDIDRGRKRSLTSCPIARAIRREDPDLIAYVLGNVVQLRVPSRMSVPLPKNAEKFVADFDSGIPVAPFTFDLELPE